MWVFCCGMQRSGSTLQFQLAAHLVEAAGKGQRVEWVKPEEFPALRDKYANEPGWKVFKNHTYTQTMGDEILKHGGMGIYSYRDLRDVFVSTQSKYELSFDQMIRSQFLEKQLKDHAYWMALPNILTSKYEEFTVDIPAEAKRIADHLGLTFGEHDLAQIANEYSIENQKQRIQQAVEDNDLAEGYMNARYNPDSLLHTDHIQSGGAGGWQTQLTAKEAAIIESRVGNWLTEHGYPLSASSLQQTWHSLNHRAKLMARKLRT